MGDFVELPGSYAKNDTNLNNKWPTIGITSLLDLEQRSDRCFLLRPGPQVHRSKVHKHRGRFLAWPRFSSRLLNLVMSPRHFTIALDTLTQILFSHVECIREKSCTRPDNSTQLLSLPGVTWTQYSGGCLAEPT